jgi:hypothetical protein
MPNASPAGTSLTSAVAGTAALATDQSQFVPPINNLETGLSGWCVATSPATPNNTYVVAPSPAVVAAGSSALASGVRIVFQANFACSPSPEVTVNGVFTAPLVAPDGSALVINDIVTGQIVEARWDENIASWRMTSWSSVLPTYVGGGVNGCAFRLTLNTGNAAGTGNGGGQMVYFSPYNGNTILLYSSSLSAWSLHTSDEISMSTATLANGMYDLFVTLVDNVETLVTGPLWTDNNTRSTPGALGSQDGIPVLASDPTQRWVGSMLVTSEFTDGSTHGWVYDNFVIVGLNLWNAYNRIPRRVNTQAADWTGNSIDWADTGVDVNFVVGAIVEPVFIIGQGVGQGNPDNSAPLEICMGPVGDGEGDGPDTNLAASVAQMETGCVSVPYCELPMTLGVNVITMWARAGVDTFTVSLLQEDTSDDSLPGVWTSGWILL